MTDGEQAIQWIEEHCHLPSGPLVGTRIVLAPFQREIIRGIYDGECRRAIISFGRKSGKTLLCALMMLLHLVGPQSRRNGRLYSTALSRGQAAMLFDLARDVVVQSPQMSRAVTIREHAKELSCPARGTLYRALSADGAINQGLNPAFVVHDELGQVEGPRSRLFEAMESASAAQPDPLTIIISTQAPTDADLMSILVDDALRTDDRYTRLFMWKAPEDADPFSDDALRAANPGFDYFINRDELRRMADDARRMPSLESGFRNMNLNQRCSQASPFISEPTWSACAGPVDESLFDKGPVWIGLDLSISGDLTANVAVARDGDKVWHVAPGFLTPSEGVAERSRRDGVPYDLWIRQGLIHATPGNTVDYSVVARMLCEWCDRADVRAIAFDRYRIAFLKAELARMGRDLPLQEFGQGYVSMAPAVDYFEGELLNGRIRHGGHPALSQCARYAIVTRDAAGNRKLDKSKATGRIDGLVALIMAMGAAQKEPVEEPFDPGVWMFDLPR